MIDVRVPRVRAVLLAYAAKTQVIVDHLIEHSRISNPRVYGISKEGCGSRAGKKERAEEPGKGQKSL